MLDYRTACFFSFIPEPPKPPDPSEKEPVLLSFPGPRVRELLTIRLKIPEEEAELYRGMTVFDRNGRFVCCGCLEEYRKGRQKEL